MDRGADRVLRRGCVELGVGEVKALQVSRNMSNMDAGRFLYELHLDFSPLCVSKGRQMQKGKT